VTEGELIRRILLAGTAEGARLFRQNVGQGWTGKATHRGSAVVIKNARPLHAGLCKGSSDIIGWRPVTITPDMVGQTVAIFTAIEVKTGRLRTTADQQRFLDAVEKAGGIADVARGVDNAVAILNTSPGRDVSRGG